MALNEMEKYQIDILIGRLKTLYPEIFNERTSLDLRRRMLDSNQDFTMLSRELNRAMQEQTRLEKLLYKYQLRADNVRQKAETEIQMALNMSEITDFKRDGKIYIKITYSDGRVQVIENRNAKDTKQIFEDIQRLRFLNSMDGIMNAEAAFKELLKDYREVALDNVMFMNQDKLNMKEQSMLNFVQINFPNNRVLASVVENIFVIKGNPDITVEVLESNGNYSLKQVGEASYGVQEQRQEIVRTEMIVERPNNIKQENSIEQLEKITEGMTEQEIVEYLKIHGKNQQQIMLILLALEEAKNKKEAEAKIELAEKPKQMVLKPDIRGKMAAFIDTIYLAFLVGMISGATFFVMLRFLLHSL